MEGSLEILDDEEEKDESEAGSNSTAVLQDEDPQHNPDDETDQGQEVGIKSPGKKVPQRSKYGYDSRRPSISKPMVYPEHNKSNIMIQDVELSVYSSKEISRMDLEQKLNANLANMSKCNIYIAFLIERNI